LGYLHDDWLLRLGRRTQCRCHVLLIISLSLSPLLIENGLVGRELLADVDAAVTLFQY
jgi:hypothetical protein